MTDIKGMSMNANGSVSQGQRIGGLGIPEMRKNIRQQIIKDFNPDIIFMQDSNILLKNICYVRSNKRYFAPRDYQSTGSEEAGIIFDASRFVKCVHENAMTELRKLYESGMKSLNSQLLSRMHAVILQTKGPGEKKILCVSWHGPHKLSDKNKIQMFKDLMYLITLYLSKKRIPVLIGGDFNLDLQEEKLFPITNPLSNPANIRHDNLLLYMYTRKLNHFRENTIDYIITSATVIGNYNFSCCPIDVIPYIKSENNKLSSEYYKAVLDHEPLIATFII